MYRKLYKDNQHCDSDVKNTAKSEKSKKNRKPTKVIKYGPPRVKESSWAKDVRLMIKAVAAFKSTEDDESDDDEDVKPPTTEEEEEIRKSLSVEKIDFHLEDNTKNHHTDQYDNPENLVVRRGQGFKLTVTCNQDYNIQANDMLFSLMTGRKPNPGRGTLVKLDLTENTLPPVSTEKWHANILEKNGKNLVVKIYPPSTCIIGAWRLNVLTFSEMGSERTQLQYFVPDEIYVICNPWCKDDEVYLVDEKERCEYVINENGELYIGSYKQIGHRRWNFGQFKEGILDTCLHILRRGFDGNVDRDQGNVVKIIRAISNMINTDVLQGNWSGDYSGGKRPTAWSGSYKILNAFDKSNGEMVKFGQCWVFSAVSTTVCRALGIPCRSVTCFASSHDTNENLTIDTVFDKEGNVINMQSKDSVWNFHVWNEAWTARRDLQPEYDGWQIFDATPQEESDEAYQCGPASRAAIRSGHVNLPFDATFVFAEVNADRIQWIVDDNGEWEVMSVEKSSVGKCISTLDPKSHDRMDITDCYKAREGTMEERECMMKAKQFVSSGAKDRDPPRQDVEINIDAKDGVLLGNSLPVDVTIKLCDCDETRTISKLRISATAKSYTNVRYGTIQIHEEENIKVEPNGKAVKVSVDVKPEQYREIIVEKAILEFTVSAIIKETRKIHIKNDDARFRQPDLTLKVVDEKPRKNEPFKLSVSFPNYMGILTNCELDIDGDYSGVENFLDEKDREKLEGNPVERIVTVKVGRCGIHSLTASFTCDQMDEMNERITFRMFE